MEPNTLITIQETLLSEISRLDKLTLDEKTGIEIARSNALTNTALTYLKSINTQLRIKEVAQKNSQAKGALEKELGISNEKKI